MPPKASQAHSSSLRVRGCIAGRLDLEFLFAARFKPRFSGSVFIKTSVAASAIDALDALSAFVASRLRKAAFFAS